MKRLLNDNESIHEGVRMNKEYRSKKSLERRFWSADIYVGIGLLMTLSTKGTSGQGVSLTEELGAPFLERRHLCRHRFANDSFHEGGEWTRSIARSRPR